MNNPLDIVKVEARKELEELDQSYCLSGCGCIPGTAYHEGLCVWGDNPNREGFTDTLVDQVALAVLDMAIGEVPGRVDVSDDSPGWNGCHEETISRLQALKSSLVGKN